MADQPGWRPLWIVAALLLGAAAALWASSRLPWAVATANRAGLGLDYQVSRSGVEQVAALQPLAVLALAGVAGAVAVGGRPRRLVGVLLALAGGVSGWLGLLAARGGSADLGTPVDHVAWGRILAVCGGVLLLTAGGWLAARGHRLPRLGARYQRAEPVRRADDSSGALWNELSEGRDPTAD